MFGFLKGLFDSRCELADRCSSYRVDAFTCNVDQRKSDGGIYCGKLREFLDAKAI